jgi:hypothetical protein
VLKVRKFKFVNYFVKVDKIKCKALHVNDKFMPSNLCVFSAFRCT